MTLKRKISENFSRAAKAYDGKAGFQKRIAENLVLHSAEYVKPHARILDLGSGTGVVAKLLQRKILQADIALGMCKESEKHSPSICADIEHMPIMNASFDVIYSASSIQWLENPENAFNEAYRMLDKGGYFFFNTFGDSTLMELKQSQEALDISSKIHKFRTQEELNIALKKTGFNIISYEKEQNIQKYKSTRDLLRSISDIGANISFSKEKPMTKANFLKLEDFYKNNFLKENSLYSTWEVLYFICQK